jgi:hypothetical protein
MAFSNSKEKEDLALVFDIGSSSVGGALFSVRQNGIPKIILSAREPIILEEKVDFDKFLSLTLQSLEIVASRIHTKGMGAPKKIYCVLSSPWYVSQTRVISLEKNVPFTFTSKLADGLIQKEIALFEEEHLAEYMHSGQAARLIEFKNINTRLNGYETPQPLNQKAKKLEMTIFVSMSPEQVLQKISAAINKHFHLQNILFSSFVFSSFVVARDLFMHQKNFLLVDIGGELTDISMTKKDILCGSISYPLGTNFIIRGISAGLGCTLPAARSFFSLYKDGHASVATEKKIEPIINQLKTEWLKKFQESLANLSNDISIPATIYLIIDKDLADFFSELIQNEQFHQYTLTDSKFQVTFLDTAKLHGFASFVEDTVRDPFLILEAIYINRCFHAK